MNEREIFIEALEKGSLEERRTYLDTACGDNVPLRSRIELLLKSHENADSLLDHPVLGDDLTETVVGHTDGLLSEPPVDHTNLLGFLQPADESEHLGRLGQYEVLEVVGRGGMGLVFKAQDTRLHRIVALKVLLPELAASPTARKRFLREARAAAAVSHDHVVTTYAVEESEAGNSPTAVPPFLAMEFIDGQSLQEKIDRQGALDLREILRIGMQAASGLAAAHAQGLIHRDVKPSNILLQNGVERVQITDFGLARAADDAAFTRIGEVAGTPQYMSPEQAQGQNVDARSDLFSLGSVLYAMCTGRSPFRAETTMASLRRVCDDMPRPIREVNSELPQWLAAVIDRLLEKDPDDRFQTAKEVADLLGNCLAHVQDPASIPLPGAVGPLPRKTAPAAGPRLRWVVAATVLLALAAALGVSEATGVTRLSGTVIRIVTGEGTLVIEVDDPSVQVSLDGEQLSITGAGIQELKLRPGQYQFQAVKGGQRVKKQLVTITRGDREVVRVDLEAARESAPETNVTAVDGSISSGAITEIVRLAHHTAPIHAIAFTPKGDKALSASSEPAIVLWNVATGEVVNSWTDHESPVFSLAISPDGQWTASGEGTGRVILRNLADGRVQYLIGHRRLTSSLVFAGRNLVTVSHDGTARQWDVETGKEIRSLTDEGRMLTVAATPDGQFVLVAGQNPQGWLWDLENGQVERRLAPAPPTWSAAMLPDGHQAITGHLDGTIRVWDLRTGHAVRTIAAHTAPVSCLAVTGDGRHCISGSNDKTLKIFELVSRRKIAEATVETHHVKHFDLSTDGRRLLSGGGEYFSESSESWKGDGDYAIRLWRLPESVWPKEAEAKAFVILGGENKELARFSTLADAVLGASAGDTIEIRGDGPFVTDPIEINHPLAIRAADRFRPVIRRNVHASPERDRMILARASLALEGLELQDMAESPEDGEDKPYNIVESWGAPVYIANCRFLTNHNRGVSILSDASLTVTRNCEFLKRNAPAIWRCRAEDSGRYVIENCVCVGGFSFVCLTFPGSHDLLVNLDRNTVIGDGPTIVAYSNRVTPDNARAGKIRVQASANVFDSSRTLLRLTPPDDGARQIEPIDQKSSLGLMATWLDKRNVFRADSAPMVTVRTGAGTHMTVVEQLADWRRFWKSSAENAFEGQLRYQGGDIRARAESKAAQLTPADFRLRPDSAGYRAGPDGKDLGADMDLVGPGEAYERWKRTPEYEKWREDVAPWMAGAGSQDAASDATAASESQPDTEQPTKDN